MSDRNGVHGAGAEGWARALVVSAAGSAATALTTSSAGAPEIGCDVAVPRDRRGPPPGVHRPRAAGKFLAVADEKLYVAGATYGAFRPGPDGVEFHDRAQVRRDFEMMARAGFNAVRIPHTVPPRHVLDIALDVGLWVMVGLSAEQYVGYLIDRRGAPDVARLVGDRAREVAGHPALLCFALGNEIPAPTARWIGKRALERYLRHLDRVVRRIDPEALVTYVNYPSTEYLDLRFLDVVAFNVYLERRADLDAYLGRLHSLAGDRPLLMSELGLDSMRNGEEAQAAAISSQLGSAFASGCAGAFIFSWTDEWHRGDHQVEDWAFGLTDRGRAPKAALAAASHACRDLPFRTETSTPTISVVVCAYDAGPTIDDCLAGIARLDPPAHEVIVIDDGSTDRTAAIAATYDVTLIRTENRGLSSARNTGAEAATGEIVAYLDSDARPDPHWLLYLATAFQDETCAGAGGPNLAPPESRRIARCVAQAPGGPVHVLLSDDTAEHLPGCNLALRRSVIEAVGGFDPQFRSAGDDVDMCWRVQELGGRLAFVPGALVWHHRRGTIAGYWKQQRGYGRAEALLAAKWPSRYNGSGHLSWRGRIYGDGVPRPLRRTQRVYHGTWGSAPFQSVYERPASTLASLPLTPEWWLLSTALAVLALLATTWPVLLLVTPLLAGSLAATLIQAWAGAHRSAPSRRRSDRRDRTVSALLTAFLHLLQPFARLRGRMASGLTPWRRTGGTPAWPRRQERASWQGSGGRSAMAILLDVRRSFELRRTPILVGGPFERWDLELRASSLGGARALLAVEEHGGGAQHVRFRVRPHHSRVAVSSAILLGAAGALAAVQQVWVAATVLLGVGAWVIVAAGRQVGSAVQLLVDAVQVSVDRVEDV